MTKVQMEAIADRAARLSVSKTDAEDAQVYAAMELDPYREYYEEYLDGLLPKNMDPSGGNRGEVQ